jgi:hypothetical protein
MLQTDNFTDSAVGWIYRTAGEFLESKPKWDSVLESTGHDAFGANRHWANGYGRT